MAFVSYITLDGNKYTTEQKSWVPTITNPSTARVTLAGTLDTTWGTKEMYSFQGSIRADISPATGYGTPAQLRTSLKKKQQITFADHYEVLYDMAVQGFEERSHSPGWDAADNAFFFTVQIVGVLQ